MRLRKPGHLHTEILPTVENAQRRASWSCLRSRAVVRILEPLEFGRYVLSFNEVAVTTAPRARGLELYKAHK